MGKQKEGQAKIKQKREERKKIAAEKQAERRAKEKARQEEQVQDWKRTKERMMAEAKEAAKEECAVQTKDLRARLKEALEVKSAALEVKSAVKNEMEKWRATARVVESRQKEAIDKLSSAQKESE